MGELKRQFAGALLVILTVASIFAAALNFQQQKTFHLPDDGVVWTEGPNGVVASYVRPGGPADRAGIKAHDILRSIQDTDVKTTRDVTELLVRISAWQQAKYQVIRGGIEFKRI